MQLSANFSYPNAMTSYMGKGEGSLYLVAEDKPDIVIINLCVDKESAFKVNAAKPAHIKECCKQKFL